MQFEVSYHKAINNTDDVSVYELKGYFNMLVKKKKDEYDARFNGKGK